MSTERLPRDDDDRDTDRGDDPWRLATSARRRAAPGDPVPALVRQLRRRLGLSQRALAAAAAVSPGTVRRAENGEEIGLPALRSLLRVGDLELTAVPRTAVAPGRGLLAQHLERGCTSRLLEALAADDPTGGLREQVVRLARRTRPDLPDTASAAWTVSGRLAAGVWLPPGLLATVWPGITGRDDRVRERGPAERPLPVVVPHGTGPHRWSEHVLLPVLSPADLAVAPGVPRSAVRTLLLAEALLALDAAGDRADRRPPPHRLPEPPRRVQREREDDLTRWGPPDDPCDGPDHRLGGPRAA